MRHIKLIATSSEYDPETIGFVIKGTPRFEDLAVDTTGRTLAHDLLEHQNGPKHIGEVWDELEALGALWFIRGQHGDMIDAPYTYNPQDSVASDIGYMFGSWDLYPGPGSLKSRKHDHDENFKEILSKARKHIRDEYDYDERYIVKRDAYMFVALHRLRIGFNKAKRRFNQYTFHGYDLFKNIMDAVKEANNDMLFAGQEFRLSYGLDRNHGAMATVTPIEDYYL